MNSVAMDRDQWQMGKTKVFIKNPESLFLLEEVRERKFDGYARKIQVVYRRWKAQQYYEELKKKVFISFRISIHVLKLLLVGRGLKFSQQKVWRNCCLPESINR